MATIVNPWSYHYIRQLAEEATVLAKEQGLEPIPARQAAMNYRHSRRFNIPFLGDYVPEGWEEVPTPQQTIVDTTGRAKPGKTILTQNEFFNQIERVNNGQAYGVIEQAQTSALIGTYRKK